LPHGPAEDVDRERERALRDLELHRARSARALELERAEGERDRARAVLARLRGLEEAHRVVVHPRIASREEAVGGIVHEQRLAVALEGVARTVGRDDLVALHASPP